MAESLPSLLEGMDFFIFFDRINVQEDTDVFHVGHGTFSLKRLIFQLFFFWSCIHRRSYSNRRISYVVRLRRGSLEGVREW